MKYPRLKVNITACETDEQLHANIEANIANGFTSLLTLENRHSGALTICGSGPSLADTCHEFKGDVMACNAAIDFLLDRGIVPKYGVILDSDPICAQFAVPRPDVTYLIAARCHPSVFKRLEGCKVVTWFPGADHDIMEFLKARKLDEPMIKGGVSVVSRCVFMGFFMGYRELHLHGVDSSYSDDGESHVGGGLVNETDMEICLDNEGVGEKFRTTQQMVAQVNEYGQIYMIMQTIGATLDVHGTGLLPAVHRRIKANEAAMTRH